MKPDNEPGWNITGFAAEKTLGKLAKWLRILGFDTLFEPDWKQETFIEKAKNRIFLTKTRHRADNITSFPNRIFIHSNDPFEQLIQVLKTIGIPSAEIEQLDWFSRCIQCNRPVVEIDKTEVSGKVPDYVYQTHDRFTICSRCQKIFWHGTHVDRSQAICNRIKKELS